VKTFTEKPNLELAQSFFKVEIFYGMQGFLSGRRKQLTMHFEKHLPDMHEIFSKEMRFIILQTKLNLLPMLILQCTNISIDFAIMEKADNVYVLPADFGWSDLGTWASIYEMAEKDYVGNAVMPADHVMMFDSSNCMVNVPSKKLVILQSLHNYIVVEANNTLLICPRSEEQNIKNIVADVKVKFGNKFI
jgi:mannose-1-phosphate guanylyltransferase